jgi:DNA-binding LacI/PurR family transcriptional regulator
VAAEISPSLTTVRQPVAEMATRALAVLIEELKSRRGSRAEHSQILSTHALIVRESSGRVPPPKTRK